MADQPISEAFDLIRQYAVREGWIPIGFRTFTVGPWTVTVNGTKDEREAVPPWHAKVAHGEIISIMLLHPFGGSAVGWCSTEDEFIADMKRTLANSASA